MHELNIFGSPLNPSGCHKVHVSLARFENCKYSTLHILLTNCSEPSVSALFICLANAILVLSGLEIVHE